MKVLLPLLVAFLVAPAMSEAPSSELQVVEGNGLFSTDLYKVLSKKEGNVFFSPISLHAVLSMAFQGAAGSTAEKFASALHISQPSLAAEGYNAVMQRLNNVPNVTLLMANKVFLMDGQTMLEDFSNAVSKKFLSEVQQVNFAQNVQAAKTINTWVEEKTHDKIKDLISKDDLNALTRLVLVNAIYFKGNWLHKFNEALTKTEPFYLNDVDTVDVQMMHQKENFLYKNDVALDAQVLEMPYTNQELSMIIILPNKKNGIGELEKKLQTTNLNDITKDMYETQVNVALPRFKIEQKIDLKDTLSQLGLEEIFDQNKANFTKMIKLKPDENLYVSKVIQKAFIEVNEEGAEAAAATGMAFAVFTSSMYVEPEIYFTVDHGFVFALKKRETHIENGQKSQPLFMGIVRKLSKL